MSPDRLPCVGAGTGGEDRGSRGCQSKRSLPRRPGRKKLLVVKLSISALGGNLLSGKLSDSISLLSLSKINLSESEGEREEERRGELHCFNSFLCTLPSVDPGSVYPWEGSWRLSWGGALPPSAPLQLRFQMGTKTEPSLGKWGKCPVCAERERRRRAAASSAWTAWHFGNSLPANK